MLLGLINLGSTSAFTAFVSVGVIALAVSYAIPIAISLVWDRREKVGGAKWNLGNAVGTGVNVVALGWIGFEVVLFSCPGVLPVTSISMSKCPAFLPSFVVATLCARRWARRGLRERFF